MRSKNVDLRKAVVHYLGSKCICCGSTDKMEIHHDIPLCYGGTHTLGNLVLLCQKCHHKTHAQFRKIYDYSINNLSK